MSRRKGLRDYLGMVGQVLFIIASLLVILLIIGLFTGHVQNLIYNFKNPYNNIDPDFDYVPPDKISCSYYDISEEHRNAFGSSNIDILMQGCLDLGGTWIEENDQMGCHWDPAVHTADCTTDAITTLKRFCEDSLLASYTCSNDIAFIGCSCKVAVPSVWEEECWWHLIADESTSIPGHISSHWYTTFVDGKFKYYFSYNNMNVDTEILKDSGIKKAWDSVITDEYVFEADPGDVWSIMTYNHNDYAIDADFKLYQWICADDELNWGPDMLGSMSQIENLQGDV